MPRRFATRRTNALPAAFPKTAIQRDRTARLRISNEIKVRCGLAPDTPLWVTPNGIILSLIHHMKICPTFYGRLTERGKCHKVALVAVMRKPAVPVNTLLRNRRGWKPDPSASGTPGCAPDQPIRQPAAAAPTS